VHGVGALPRAGDWPGHPRGEWRTLHLRPDSCALRALRAPCWNSCATARSRQRPEARTKPVRRHATISVVRSHAPPSHTQRNETQARRDRPPTHSMVKCQRDRRKPPVAGSTHAAGPAPHCSQHRPISSVTVSNTAKRDGRETRLARPVPFLRSLPTMLQPHRLSAPSHPMRHRLEHSETRRS